MFVLNFQFHYNILISFSVCSMAYKRKRRRKTEPTVLQPIFRLWCGVVCLLREIAKARHGNTSDTKPSLQIHDQVVLTYTSYSAFPHHC